jgi:poly(hydroxyalkanoate) depolymerase family esterase
MKAPMTSLFQKLMGDAARLTSQGDLQGATAMIQRALGQMPSVAHPDPVAAHDVNVIDVEAREVPATSGHGAWIEAAAAVQRAAHAASSMSSKQSVQPASPVPPTSTTSTTSTMAPKQPSREGTAEGEIVRGTHASAAGQRDWRLYVPPAYTGQAMPLVVMLHGCTQDPDDFAVGTGMDEAARREGFFVLYPAQAQSANPQRCWNWFKHNHQERDRGEPALIAGLTREVMAKYGVDPSRVYVAGLSAGGAMAAILGQTYPDIYAAVGVHSGLAAGAANDLPSALAAMQGGTGGIGSGAASMATSQGLANLPGLRLVGQTSPAKGRPAARNKHVSVPTIVFHGDRDHTVHPVNADHVVAACVPAHGEAAANDAAARFSEEKARSPNGRTYTRRTHADGSGRQVAEHWMVHGAGHAWSGGNARGSYTDAQGPDATSEMLRFFFAHPQGSH